MKNNLSLFERPFKVQKNGVFLFEITFFVLKTRTFFYFLITGIIQAKLINLSIKMTTLHQSGVPFVGERVFQNQGVWRQALPSFPSPTPFLPPFCSCPIFYAAWMRKTFLRGPNFVRFVQECLLHRLDIALIHYSLLFGIFLTATIIELK